MKINNSQLPEHLMGKNSKEYVHDTARYKTSNFTMRLQNGKSMPCKEWAEQVEDWESMRGERSKMGIQDFGPDGMSLNSYAVDAVRRFEEMRKTMDCLMATGGFMAPKKRGYVKPLNTTFYDCGDVCKVTWADGTTTTVKWDGEDDFNENLAIAIAFIKKTFGLSVYDELLASVDRFEIEEEQARDEKRRILQEQEEKRQRAYRKAVKAAARRKKKRAQFAADVRRELDTEFI